MKDNSKGGLTVGLDSTFLILVVVSSLIFLFLIFLLNKDIFKPEDKGVAGGIQDQGLTNDQDTSLNKYFERNLQSESDEQEGFAAGLSEDECKLFGQVVREGTVNYGTTCVNDPSK